jgi:threonyl-tRNA synthetase
MVIWNTLEDLRRRENLRRGYVEVKTPILYDEDTYETSGHLQNYEENIFWVKSHEEHERRYAMKPMNCPGHMLLFGSALRSYRDLPFRFAESSTLHRDELTGALHGLLRVKHITQDDAHIFCTREQIEDEIFGCLDFAGYLYDLFAMEARFELSTRPEKRVGADEEWDFTESALRSALERREIDYLVNDGDGAFYGPKIDLHMTDVLGRSWQMGTIQLDAQMPKRFGLTYMGADNAEHTPYVIHRALLGSLERFIGILTEHYGGAFPFWLAPVQVRILPVGLDHHAAVHSLAQKLDGYRVEVDDSDETVGKRIRNGEVDKIPFVIVYGDKESDDALAVREHRGEQSTRSLAELLAQFATLSA